MARRIHWRTAQTLTLLTQLRDGEETYGWEIEQATGMSHGTAAPILRRLHGMGLIVQRWEPPGGGRPPRSLVRLADEPTTRERVGRLLGQYDEYQARRPR